MATIRVLLADAQRMFADAVGRLLALQPDFDVIDEFPGGGPETIDAAVLFHPDVAVLDYWLAGMDGPAVCRAIQDRAPNCKIILLSWFYKADHVQAAFDAGAVGFVPKSLTVTQLEKAIRRAHAGESPVFGKELAGLVEAVSKREDEAREVSKRLGSLTPQEIRVLILLSLGLNVENICERLVISRGTARNHIQKILSKLGARSQIEAVAIAQQYGLIQGGPLTLDEGPPAPPRDE
ncbi:MAG: response regulator [Actinomycetota bacterium]